MCFFRSEFKTIIHFHIIKTLEGSYWNLVFCKSILEFYKSNLLIYKCFFGFVVLQLHELKFPKTKLLISSQPYVFCMLFKKIFLSLSLLRYILSYPLPLRRLTSSPPCFLVSYKVNKTHARIRIRMLPPVYRIFRIGVHVLVRTTTLSSGHMFSFFFTCIFTSFPLLLSVWLIFAQ